jgi:IS605 OrfB family transposase
MPKFDDIHKSGEFGKTDEPGHGFHPAENSAVGVESPTSFEHGSGKTCFCEPLSFDTRFPPEAAVHLPARSAASKLRASEIECFFYLGELDCQFSDHLLIFSNLGLNLLSFLLNRWFSGQSFQAALKKCIPPTVIQGLADVVPAAQFRYRNVPLQASQDDIHFFFGCPLATFHLRFLLKHDSIKTGELYTSHRRILKWGAIGSHQWKKYNKAKQYILSKTKAQSTDALHKISRKFVNWCIEQRIKHVVVGDVEGVQRNTKKKRRKTVNEKLSQWQFGQLLKYLEYKLQAKGITLEKVKHIHRKHVLFAPEGKTFWQSL